MIDRATVDKIMDATDIVDVVSEFVSLRKAGVNYKGLCPFHDDKTPSFMVSPTKQICHCFACGKGGNAVNFLMEHEQITYPEALRWLAKKYSIEIQERELSVEEKQEQSERESMFIVNEWAKDYFHHILLDHEDGRAIGLQYFRSRSIRDDIIEKFQLGFALPKRDSLSTAALQKGYKEEFLVKTGLCYRREDPPALVDRYAGRVIFPWFNVSGKVVAFGGRLLDSRTKGVQQKYVNSPDSEIYHKERELYGLYQAKRAIAKEDRVFMVEGYTDVIAMHQAGVENVVANSGTALSVYQANMLHRLTNNITLLYDSDEAGIHAAMRGTDILLREGMNIKVLLLPDGDDPDSFARKHSTDELRRYIGEHQEDFIAFKTRLTVEGIHDPVKRTEGISGIVRSISVIPDAILRSTYIGVLASRLGLKESTLLDTMNKYIRQDIEEKERERERMQRMAQAATGQETEQTAREGTTADGASAADGAAQTDGNGTTVVDAAPSTAPTTIVRPESIDGRRMDGGTLSSVETMLMREIVRHGEVVIVEGAETEDGRLVNMTVAQYVGYDLGLDGLTSSTPIDNRRRNEAVVHSGQQDFHAELFFTNHADLEISNVASQLAVDRHQLGGRLVMEPNAESIRQRVVHLVMDLRMDLVNARLKTLQQAIRQASGDMGHVMELMEEYKETQQLRNVLAKKLGSDVIV